jgi:zinc transporter ZupT
MPLARLKIIDAANAAKREEFIMNLNAPKNVTFIISVILIVGGLVSYFIFPTSQQDNALFITFAGGVLLTLGNLIKGM